MRAAIAATRALPFPIPAELDAAWAWMEERGYGGIGADGSTYLTPYPGDFRLGAEFTSSASHEGLVPDDEAHNRRVIPLGKFAGDGSVGMLWQDEDGSVRVAVISTEGEANIIADDALEFLRLLAIGYLELLPPNLDAPPEDQASIDGVADFRHWVSQTYDVTIPDQWYDVDDHDAFTGWFESAWGHEPEAPPAPPDAALDVPMTGTIETLVGALGTPDGSPQIAEFARLAGVQLTDGSLKRSGPALRAAGVQKQFARGVLETVFLTTASDGEPTYPRTDALISGITTRSTPQEVEALLGEPERRGTHKDTAWLRYVTAGRFVHLEFESDRLSQVTVMTTAS